MHSRAIHKRFCLKETKHGIVEVDGPNLVILDRQKEFYLIYRHESADLLQQLQVLLDQVSISMYMEVPLRNTESIIDEEKFVPDESEQDLLEILKKQEMEKA